MAAGATPGPGRTALVIAGVAAAAGIALLAVHGLGPQDRSAPDVDGGSNGSGSGHPGGGPPRVRAEPARPSLELPRIPEEELRALAPDDAGVHEVMEREFQQMGGVRSPGSDPAGARAELGRPGWGEAQEALLRRGLESGVVAAGARLDRVECQAGRCLVELSYDSMTTALGRSGAIRRWMTEQVRCPSFTEGPDEGDSPVTRPSQQVWILCGEPPPPP